MHYRHILVINENDYLKQNLTEFVKGFRGILHFANERTEIIHLMKKHKIEMIIVNFCSLKDVKFLNYFKKYHTEVELIIKTDNEMEEAISVLRNNDFNTINNSASLMDMANQMNFIQ